MDLPQATDSRPHVGGPRFSVASPFGGCSEPGSTSPVFLFNIFNTGVAKLLQRRPIARRIASVFNISIDVSVCDFTSSGCFAIHFRGACKRAESAPSKAKVYDERRGLDRTASCRHTARHFDGHSADRASGYGGTLREPSGREVIDFAGGIGVMNVGHCQPSVVKAIAEQASQLLHTCFQVATYEPYVALCEKLAELLPHVDLSRANPKKSGHTKTMLVNSGAEAVENAVKIARQATNRSAIICYTEGFHGRTMMAMSLTSKFGYKIGCGPYAPEVYRLPFPNHYRYGDGLSEAAFVERELNRFRESLFNTVAAEQVAAVILEPVQGEGGFVPAPVAYLQGSARVVRPARHHADSGRSAIGILSDRTLGRLRTLWRAARYFDVGQVDGGWLADRRRDGTCRRHGRRATRHDRWHLWRQSRRLRCFARDDQVDGRAELE